VVLSNLQTSSTKGPTRFPPLVFHVYFRDDVLADLGPITSHVAQNEAQKEGIVLLRGYRLDANCCIVVCIGHILSVNS
jgi:hypothetical protein